MTGASSHYFMVDAFTNRPFSGNPAAVVLFDRWPTDRLLKNVAVETNLAVTAFLVANSKGFDLRWLTPHLEFELCGHGTLAAARVLAELGYLTDGAIVSLSTRGGVLNASLKGQQFQLDFPTVPEIKTETPDGLVDSFQAEPVYVGKNRLDYIVEFASESIVRNLKPDFKRLAEIDCRGLIVTAKSDSPDFDFVSRFFSPRMGMTEDSVTGSAHCCLAGFWESRLGKTVMIGFQASKRSGIVHVERRQDRVILGGEAVIIAKGELLSPLPAS